MSPGRVLSILSLLGALAACQAVPPEQPPAAAEQAAAPGVDYQAEPGLAARRRLRKIISFLEEGDPARAAIELAAFEAEDGDPKLAAFWREQIERDPNELYEPGGEAYQVRAGETLSTIARKFLGDPLRFYMLARFNGIETPSRIEAGQTVTIPNPRLVPLEPLGDAAGSRDWAATAPEPADAAAEDGQSASAAPALPPAPSETPEANATTRDQPAAATESETAPADTARAAPQPAAQPADTSQPAAEPAVASRGDERDLIVAAIQSAGQGDMAGAITVLEDGLARYPDNAKLREAAVLAYQRHSDTLVDRGEPEAAAVALVKALALAPDDEALAAKLERARNLARSQAFLAKGKELAEAGELDEAYDATRHAVEIAPGNREAASALAGVKEALVERNHTQAITALRDGDLDRALVLWERVLEVDPANQTADRYFKHTLDLKQRAKIAAGSE